MKHLKIFLLLLIISKSIFGQNEIKFQVEDLSKPEHLLTARNYNELYEKLILSDLNMFKWEIEKDSIDFPFNIIAKSKEPDSLVTFGYHSFFNGMYQAYADHRPFVISPDMIWLLISQGFARHVSANSELIRDKFVDFDGKLSLAVHADTDLIHNCTANSWEKIFPDFTKQISEYTGEDFIDLLSADFSTTTSVDKVASQITIMEAMEPYFEFIVFYCVCGIPEITLKGTTEDWQKIYDKTEKLGEYDLGWWTDELKPILKEFIKTSKGDINKKFWRNMFKYHSQKKYGAPKIIDGWIVKFFPYDKNGKRNNLKKLNGGNNLPDEIIKVNLNYVELLEDTIITTPLELWAGFIGLKQNTKDYSLTPQIGWMIRKKDIDTIGLTEKLKSDNDSDWGISIRVKNIPQEIYELKHIKSLEVEFIDEIIIPDKLSEMSIDNLYLSGKIKESEIERIKSLFPNSNLKINKEIINNAR